MEFRRAGTRARTIEFQEMQDKLDAIRRIIADNIKFEEGLRHDFFYHADEPDKVVGDEMEIDHRCIDSFLQEFHVAEIV